MDFKIEMQIQGIEETLKTMKIYLSPINLHFIPHIQFVTSVDHVLNKLNELFIVW